MKKRILSILLVVLMLVGMMPTTIFATEADGWATVSDATWYNDVDTEFTISTAYQLAGLAELVNGGNNFAGKTVKLGADIYLSGCEWTPIGTAKANSFSGTFDGQNKTISGLYISGGINYAGLFGCVQNATVKNVTVQNVSISGNWYVGAIVGRSADSTTGTVISDCNVTGNIAISGYADVGGVIGVTYGNPEGSGDLIDNCHVSGTIAISGTGAYIGGILGNAFCTKVTNSSVNGLSEMGESSIFCDQSYTGGIIGFTEEYGLVLQNCSVSNIAISAKDTVGGVVGIAQLGNRIVGCSVDKVAVTAGGTDGTSGMIAGCIQGDATKPVVLANNTVTESTRNGEVSDLQTSGVDSNGAANANYAVGQNVVLDDNNKVVSGDFSVFNPDIADKILAANTELVANDDGTYGVVAYVAQVGEEKYTDLQEAIDNATGSMVTLLNDVQLDTMLNIASGVNLTLDLNGMAITVTKSGDRSLYAFKNDGNLTLTDSVGTGSITARGNYNYGTMVMNGGTIVACDTNGGYGIWNYGNFTMNGGKVMVTHVGHYCDDAGPTGIGNMSGATALITGGTLESASARTYVLYSEGNLTITPAEGKEVTVTAPRAVSIAGGTAVVNGGNFTTYDAGTGVAAEVYYPLYVSGGEVTVNGGNFNAPDSTDSRPAYSIMLYGNTGKVTLTGGTYTNPIDIRADAPQVTKTDNVELNVGTEGFEWVDGVLTARLAVAEVNGVQYSDLQEAINVGSTVTLLADVALTTGLEIAKGNTVVLELNGYTISYASSETTGNAAITNLGNLTIEDTVGTGKVTYTSTANGGYNFVADTIINNGTLTIVSGTIENNTAYGNAAYAIDNISNSDAAVIINGGTITSQNDAIRMFANSDVNANALTINGGTITGYDVAVWLQLATGASTSPEAVLTINEGTLSTQSGYAAVFSSSSGAAYSDAAITVTGGTIDGKFITGGYYSYYSGTGAETVTITGGTFNDAISHQNLEENISIQGGTFAKAVPESYCAEGFEPVDNGDGTFGVVETETETIGSGVAVLGNWNEQKTVYSFYMFSGIDSLNYREVGFEITTSDGISATASTKTVYSQIIANSNGVPTTFGASAFNRGDYEAYRIFGQGIDFPASYVAEHGITFRSYAIKMDGTKIYGSEVTLETILLPE